MFASMHQLKIRAVDGCKFARACFRRSSSNSPHVTRSTVLLANWPRLKSVPEPYELRNMAPYYHQTVNKTVAVTSKARLGSCSISV